MTDGGAVRPRIAGEPRLHGTPGGGVLLASAPQPAADIDAFVHEPSPDGASVHERDASGETASARQWSPDGASVDERDASGREWSLDEALTNERDDRAGSSASRRPAPPLERRSRPVPTARPVTGPAPVLDPITAVELEHRLAARRRHPTGRAGLVPRRRRVRSAPAMGYQPGLDGLRALSVVAIMLYHGGFAWIHGGFVAVDVFFATSGFLITTLLLEETERRDRVSLRGFWTRRARRLLPALGALLAVVAAVTLIVGTADQLTTLRRDLPWALLYASNWGQITGDAPYWAADPPLLRHLWTLAIEEQFYLLWPLAFVVLARWRRATAVRLMVVLAATSAALGWIVHAGGPGPMGGMFAGADRVNFDYLATVTRAAPLLLGAAAAFVWRPWRARRRPPVASARLGRTLDHVGAVTLGVFACISVSAAITAGYVYQWLLPTTAVLATVLVLVVVHPAAAGMRRWLSWGPLVAVGQRSYGLYLWHWPVFVFAGAIDGDPDRFLGAVAVAAVLSEISYRFVERPARDGRFTGWWRHSPARQRWAFAAVAAVVTVALAVAYVLVQPTDPAVRDDGAVFTAPTTTVAAAPPAAAPATTTTVPATVGPLGVTVVGDSVGHALAANQPSGMGDTFSITDGAVVGCSVFDDGSIITARAGVANNFARCQGWQDEWAASVRQAGAGVALVVLGAWDVFDLRTDAGTLAFGTAAWDEHYVAGLQRGIDAVAAAGARVALLEAACMRPQDVPGAGVPALPERADDSRVAHVNDLLRQAAAANAATTTFVAGPEDWCSDPSAAQDLALRWDGVHVTGKGAALVYEAIADSLLALGAQPAQIAP